ncbi:hypothetical protein, partial [Xylophilus sp. Leaf220]|uniref:hypothetical protein n=1 Tax=Xylophilus sp. Leaf220 TaxID=1735686 RepID=UPI001F38B622
GCRCRRLLQRCSPLRSRTDRPAAENGIVQGGLNSYKPTNNNSYRHFSFESPRQHRRNLLRQEVVHLTHPWIRPNLAVTASQQGSAPGLNPGSTAKTPGQ